MESLYGELGVIGMRGCEGFVSQVDAYLREWRRHDDDQRSEERRVGKEC